MEKKTKKQTSFHLGKSITKMLHPHKLSPEKNRNHVSERLQNTQLPGRPRRARGHLFGNEVKGNDDRHGNVVPGKMSYGWVNEPCGTSARPQSDLSEFGPPRRLLQGRTHYSDRKGPRRARLDGVLPANLSIISRAISLPTGLHRRRHLRTSVDKLFSRRARASRPNEY